MDFQTKQNLIIPGLQGLSIARQAKLLNISRSGFYYKPASLSPEEIRIMGCIDKIFTDCPFYGSRRIKHELESQPYKIFICREHVQHLMRQMGLEAIYPKKITTIPNLQHLKYPYLLKNLPIVRPNQVWGTDITYIKLLGGFCYLVALLDWFSRYGEYRDTKNQPYIELQKSGWKGELGQELKNRFSSASEQSHANLFKMMFWRGSRTEKENGQFKIVDRFEFFDNPNPPDWMITNLHWLIDTSFTILILLSETFQEPQKNSDFKKAVQTKYSKYKKYILENQDKILIRHKLTYIPEEEV